MQRSSVILDGAWPTCWVRARRLLAPACSLWLACAEAPNDAVEVTTDSSSSTQPVVADVEVALQALVSTWELEYSGNVPPVQFEMHWVAPEDLQALGWSAEVTGVAYDLGEEAAGQRVSVWVDSTLTAARLCALLIHEFAHGFEYATGVEALDHVTPEVWSKGGIVSRAQTLAGQSGCLHSAQGEQHPDIVYTETWGQDEAVETRAVSE